MEAAELVAGPGERGGDRRWSRWTGWVDSPRTGGGRVDGQVDCLLNGPRAAGAGFILWAGLATPPATPPGPRPGAARRGKGSWLFLPLAASWPPPRPFLPLPFLSFSFCLCKQYLRPKAAARNSALKVPSKCWHILGPETQTPEEAAAACSHRTEREAEARTGRGVLWHWNPAV